MTPCGGGERDACKSTIKMAFCDTRVILKQGKLTVFYGANVYRNLGLSILPCL